MIQNYKVQLHKKGQIDKEKKTTRQNYISEIFRVSFTDLERISFCESVSFINCLKQKIENIVKSYKLIRLNNSDFCLLILINEDYV